MAYPNDYVRQGNFSQDDAAGLAINAARLDAEYNSIQAVLAQLNVRLRDITTATGNLRLNASLRQVELFETEEFTATAGQTVFTFGTSIDSSQQLVRLFVDGSRILQSLVTITDDDITFPALTVGQEGLVEIYSEGDGILVLLADADASDGQDGAALVGWGDINARTTDTNLPDTGSPTTVTAALDLAFLNLISLATSLLPASQWLRADGSVVLTDHWLVNARQTGGGTETRATGQITLSSNPVDTDTITINDGFIVSTYEFDDDVSVTSGNILVTIGVDIQATGANLAAAITASAQAFDIVEVDNTTTYDVNLTNQLPGTAGNVLMTENEAGTTIALTGMSGGTDLTTLEPLINQCRIRNVPASARNGDVVVHEQLQAVTNIINTLSLSFLKTDGTSTMTGNLDMGGQSIESMVAGVAGTDGVNVTQLNAVEAAKLSLTGLKDSTSDGTITGGVSLGANVDGTDVADADQLTDPDVVVVHTFTKVPQAGADDQFTNLLQVNNLITSRLSAIQLRTGTLLQRADSTQTIGVIEITKEATGHHQIIVPAGITVIKLEGLGAGGGGGAGITGSDGVTGGKTYFTIDTGGGPGSDQDLGLGGVGGADGAGGGSAGGAGGAVGAAAEVKREPGVTGEAGFNSAGNNHGGSGGESRTQGGRGGYGKQMAVASLFGTAAVDGSGHGAGGGGGDGATTSSGGGGGGGGGYGEVYIDVSLGDIIDIFEGAGGGGSGTGGDGAAGFMRVSW